LPSTLPRDQPILGRGLLSDSSRGLLCEIWNTFVRRQLIGTALDVVPGQLPLSLAPLPTYLGLLSQARGRSRTLSEQPFRSSLGSRDGNLDPFCTNVGESHCVRIHFAPNSPISRAIRPRSWLRVLAATNIYVRSFAYSTFARWIVCQKTVDGRRMVSVSHLPSDL
jgi:hypothetical protein